MIKYLRDKITGRPAVFSRVGDLPIDENLSSMNKSDSQNSLTDLSSNDQIQSTIATRRSITSSSPIIIPKKPPRSNASSQSSSSYASIADPIPSLSEFDDAVFPPSTLPCQRLEHSAARDRISVKNKRRQPLKQKLTTLCEADDDLFRSKVEVLSSTPDDEPIARLEPKAPRQPLIDLADLDNARTRLRVSVRTRDRSADNILLSTNESSLSSTVAKSNPFMQRSMSFKRPQDFVNRRQEPSLSPSSSNEHIYDNLDVFKQSNDNSTVKIRDQSSTRIRPVTMHASASNDKEITNEFENVFNQLKRRSSIRTTEEKKIDNEPPPISPTQSNNRRKILPSVHLTPNNKVATDQTQPTPSWIDIAKQKQSKFQSVSNEITESEPMIITRKSTPTTDARSNRKSMFESSTVLTSPPVLERESIRALKAGNPNRINNLIQFFDK